MRRSLVLALAAVCAGACAPAPPPMPTGLVLPSSSVRLSSMLPSAAPIVTEAANGMSYERPSNWTRWVPNQPNPMVGGPTLYLSTDPLLPTCATAPEASPNRPDTRGTACHWPLASLSPDGVLVEWYSTRILGPLPSAGEVIHINGASARLRIDRPGSCAEIGGDETMGVLVPIGMVAPWSNVGVIACLRGPDLASSEEQVRAMFSSVTGAR